MLPETRLAPQNALNVFDRFRRTQGFNPDACAMSTDLQPSLDLGVISLGDR
jgi:hypothetical protein